MSVDLFSTQKLETLAHTSAGSQSMGGKGRRGASPMIASNTPQLTAQLGTKDQPNFHVPLMIAEKSSR